jgi:phosphopantetheine adenylyltransferase
MVIKLSDMMKTLLPSAILVLSCATLNAGEYSASAVQAARELSGAVKSGDMMWLVDNMYPPMKKKLIASFRTDHEIACDANGNSGVQKRSDSAREASFMESMRKRMADAAAEMKRNGVKIESFEIGEPVGEYLVKNGTEVVVILPTRMVLSKKVPPSRLEVGNSPLVMVKVLKARDATTNELVDKESPWYLIDAKDLSVNSLRSIFYDLPLTVELPSTSIRQLPVTQS